MRLTFLQIVNEILMRANIDTISGLTTPIPNTRRVMNAVNAASENLSRLHDWNFLLTSSTRTTTASSRNIVLADSAVSYDPIRKPKRLSRVSPSYYEITEANNEEWERDTGRVTPNPGSPRIYRRFGISSLTGGSPAVTYQGALIQLDPRPTSAITITVEHYQLPARMTVDADTTIWPDQALILEAVKIYHDMKGRDAREVEKERDFILGPLIRIDAPKPRLRTGMLSGRYVPNQIPQLPSSVTDF